MRNFLDKNKNVIPGFTLLEVLVAMGIFMFVAVGASWLAIHGFRYNRIIWDQLQAQNDGRKVIQSVVNLLRQAEESSIGSYPLGTAGPYEIVFYANIDDDSLKERVRFWLDGTNLKRGIIKPSGNPLSYSGSETIVLLAHDMINISKNTSLFSYYDENYSGTQSSLPQPVDPVQVRVVRVRLILDRKEAETPVPFYAEGLVQIRNLKMN